ncbi:MAG: PatB family C-S lyase [Candidatus Competibacteraceae bacterium]
MRFNFDTVPDRRDSDSVKWQRYGPEVLPLWVADMDFPSPEPIIEALQQRVAHGVFGYGVIPQELPTLLCERLLHRYRWTVEPEQIVFLPGLVSGLNVVCRAVGESGDGVLVQTPVYPPFLTAATTQDRRLQTAELAAGHRGEWLYYEPDYDTLAAAVTTRTRLFILCHPHNPVGRVYTRTELAQLAEFCLRHKLVICSDEIHCDLLLGSQRHQPLATLDPAVAKHCITLMAPSKTFNIAGLGISFAIIQDAVLRRRFKAAMASIVPHINILGFTAALAAYRDCEAWLTALLGYLTANRDYLLAFVQRHLPGIRTTRPEATYLAWLDCRQAKIPGNPHVFLLEHAKVACNDGATFGPGGEGFIRLNFGCPRSFLTEGLERIRATLAQAG